MALFVAVAHSGKTLQLGVQPTQRVEAVQQALVTFTGIPIADQIVMLAGAKLDAARPLSAYRLPLEDLAAAAENPVILYCKSYLRPDGVPPPQEALPPIIPQVPPALPSAALASAVAAHPLSHSPHPAVRSLPGHEAAFSHHAAKAAAYLQASLARLHRCRQLLSEQEVQSRAADAATVNVEAHYSFISSAMASFTTRYNQQCADHAQLLASFSEDQALLDSIPLHPMLQQGTAQQGAGQQGAGQAQAKRLADLPGAVRAREVATACRKHHGHFADKVSQLEGVYDSMKLDMEALIMQAPSVDLDAMGLQLAEAEEWVQEQDAIAQVLSKDLTTLQQLVERVVRQSASAPSPARTSGSAAAVTSPAPAAPEGVLDACAAVQALAQAHTATQLPRVEALDAAVAVLEERCQGAKERMTADVVAMLQCISQQQSKIRDMRGRLAGFDALLQRQAYMFAELRPLGRLPAAYRGLLAECERVRAWHQLKAGQASEFVDQLVSQYQAEGAKRRAFIQQVERYLPADLVTAAGLHDASHLGLPAVSVPPAPPHLLPVSLLEVQRLPAAPPSVTTAMAAMSQLLQAGPPGASGDGGAAGGGGGGAQGGDEMLMSQAGGGGEGEREGQYAPTLPDPTSMHRLEMDNARLRAELAEMMVEASLARLQQAGAMAAPAGAPPGLASGYLGRALAASQAAGPAGQAPLAPAPSSGEVALQGITPRQSFSAGQQQQSTGHATAAAAGAAGTSPAAIPGRALASSTSGAGSSSSSWRRHTATAVIPAPASPYPVPTAAPGAPHSAAAHARSHSYTPSHISQHSLGTSPGTRPVAPLPSGPMALAAFPAGGISSLALAGPGSHPQPGSHPPGQPTSQHHIPGALSRQASSLSSAAAAATTPLSPGIHPGAAAAGPAVAGSTMLQSGAAGWGSGAPGLEQQAVAAVSALQQAVAMKDAYCAALQHEIHALSKRVGTYEGRIMELEERLAAGRARSAETGEAGGTEWGARQAVVCEVVMEDPGQPECERLPAGSSGGAQPAAASGGGARSAAGSSGGALQAAGSSGGARTAAGSSGGGAAGVAGSTQQAAAAAAGRQLPSQPSPQPPPAPQQQHDATDYFDPLASSSFGDAQVGPAGDAGDGGASGRASELRPEASSLALGSSSCCSSGAAPSQPASGGASAHVAAGPASAFAPRSNDGSGASAGSAPTAKPCGLGPIAMAAMGGSRGHTPEPHQRPGAFALPPAAGAAAAGTAAEPPAAMPLLLGSRAPTPDPAAEGGPWAIHPHPLFRGRWGSAVLHYEVPEPLAGPAAAGGSASGGGGSGHEQQPRGHSHDGVVPPSPSAAGVAAAVAAPVLAAMASAPPALSGSGASCPSPPPPLPLPLAVTAAGVAVDSRSGSPAVRRPVAVVGVPVLLACEAAVVVATASRASSGALGMQGSVAAGEQSLVGVVASATVLLPATTGAELVVQDSDAEQPVGSAQVGATDESQDEAGLLSMASGPGAEAAGTGAASITAGGATVGMAAAAGGATAGSAAAPAAAGETPVGDISEGFAAATALAAADDDDAVPDIDVMMGEGEGEGVTTGPGGSAGGAPGGRTHDAAPEPRTWPAAGSGLGASGFAADVVAGAGTGTWADGAGGLGVGAGRAGHAASGGAAGVGAGGSEGSQEGSEGSGLQGSMYASAMGAESLQSASQHQG